MLLLLLKWGGTAFLSPIHSLHFLSFMHSLSLILSLLLSVTHSFPLILSLWKLPGLKGGWSHRGLSASTCHQAGDPLVRCVKGVGGIVLSLGGTRLAQAGSSLSSTGRPVLTWSPGFGRCWGGHSLGLVCGWGAYGLGHYLHRRARGQGARWSCMEE